MIVCRLLLLYLMLPLTCIWIVYMLNLRKEITGTYEYRTETYSNNYERTRVYFENPSSLELTMPNDIDEMITFISDSKEFYRIGRKTMVDAQDVLREELFPSIINKDLEKLRTAFTDKQVETLINGFERFENLRHSIWLSQHHIPPNIQQKLFKLNKSFDPRDIKNNPYELVTLGLSFEQADKIAKESFGFTGDHPYRLIGATNDALKSISKWGNTWATADQVLPLVRKRLKLDVNEFDLTESAMSLAVRKFGFTEINGRFHHGTYLFMEMVITHRFKSMLSTKAEWTDLHPEVINKAMENNPFSLTEKQAEAVFKALEYNLATIIGGAGTGKTTVLRTVLRAFHELGYNIHAVALAGKAAMTLKKSVGFQTSTIARFLGQKPLVEGKHVVIIDEASMVDLPTMFQIVLHCSPDVRFILVGDDNQLASIRAGLVLTDMVRSGVMPVTELDIVQRQEGATGIPDYSRNKQHERCHQ
ncbi:hypothetical protein C9J47_10625 [Photobacterium indicum]|uniref:ATP-dependent RecD2 DNA helicase-like helix-hairpin-helix domain-containing protein n=2 Tax=Photobacterium indicum TaxID=81447 RepID=A0A2T3L8K0_9GAMM|nr:hypothetical protein C9J47_10625 [Photobacterium indicum]